MVGVYYGGLHPHDFLLLIYIKYIQIVNPLKMMPLMAHDMKHCPRSK